MYQGGCFCGNIRYAVSGEPTGAAYCHCRMCQRATGAPVTAWATFPKAQFQLLQGNLAEFPSSKHARRGFCAVCGTSISFTTSGDEEENFVDILTATFDDPSLFAPRFHIHMESQVPWLKMGDDLPRHLRHKDS